MKRFLSILMVIGIIIGTVNSQCIKVSAVNPRVIPDGGYIVESLVGQNMALDVK